MVHPEIIERLSRLPSGGVINDQNRFDYGYLSSLLDTFRAKVINIQYNGDRFTAKSRRINPVCYQKHWPVYEKELQEAGTKFVLFRCPEFISIDGLSDGLRYVGSIEGSCSFRRLKTRTEISMYNSNKITNLENGRFQSALYDGSQGMIEVYGNKALKELLVEGLFSNPLLIPTYNKDVDQYPLDASGIVLLESLLLKEQLQYQAATPITNEYLNKIG